MQDLPSPIKVRERRAWKPVTVEGDTDLKGSKFSGQPWLAAGESWPVCRNCGKPMQLLLQLNFNNIPESVREQDGTGLLQLFYCVNDNPCCEIECEAWAPFSNSVLLRRIESIPEPANINETIPDNYFPAKTIVGWEEVEDYPTEQEAKALGVEITQDEQEIVESEASVVCGDKLGGWPNWFQSIEYPDCPVCHETMELFFQLQPGKNLPYGLFGCGCGHITRCKQHRNQFAFGWAC